MSDNNLQLQILYERFINDTATPGEVREFWTLFHQSAEDHPIRNSVFMLYHDKVPAELENKDWTPSINRILKEENGKEETGRMIKMRRNLTKIAVAASVILTLGIGSYFLYFNDKEKNQVVKTTPTNDVKAPESNRAMITLANGQTVALDSVTSGTLATQSGVNVIKNANGEIVYNGNANEVVYNTLYNPRGSRVVNLRLQDGSKVWLNAESSLKYPVAFIGKDRKIEITGEAYFEVAHDATRKFLVTANGVTTEVLGTHFNVNAYMDDGSIKVTLLEGAIKVSKNSTIKIIKPGQQAQVGEGQEIKVVAADVEQDVAWKNGMFIYKGADLQTIMRQVARWYDVEIVFEKEVKEKFYADVSRNTNVSSLFKMLETTKAVHFKIEGKKVTVMP